MSIDAYTRGVLAERERCARIVEGEIYKERYRMWPYISVDMNRSEDSDIARHCNELAAAIRGTSR